MDEIGRFIQHEHLLNRATTPVEHLNRVSQGLFPRDTKDFLTAMVNKGLRDPRHVHAYAKLSARLSKHQRNQIIRELWEIMPGDSDLARAKALISGYRRFSGRVPRGKPAAALYERLRALELAGTKIPGWRQVLRICGQVNER